MTQKATLLIVLVVYVGAVYYDSGCAFVLG
jgi:hypothetical protein